MKKSNNMVVCETKIFNVIIKSTFILLNKVMIQKKKKINEKWIKAKNQEIFTLVKVENYKLKFLKKSKTIYKNW